MTYRDFFNKTPYMQYVSSVSAALFLTCAGMYTCWSSPTLPRLISNDSPIGITLTPAEASLVASSYQLGYLPGGILSAWMVSRYGPKTSILVSVAPLCCPWIVVVFAESAVVLCMARFIGGVAGAIVATAVPIYNAEVSDKDIRGRLGSTFSLLVVVGNLIALTIGPFASYVTLAIICGMLPLIYGVIFWFMPESPYYLVKVQQTDKARKSILRLSAQNTNQQKLQERFDEVTNTIEHDMKNKLNFGDLFTNSAYKKPLIIMTGIRLIQQFSGSSAVDVYMQTIMKHSNSSISPESSSIMFGVVQLLPVFVAATLVDKAGRKPLLILSTIGSAFALTVEGLYFYLNHNDNHSISAPAWLPILGLGLYLIMHPLGLGTLFYVLLGEVFPTNIKCHAVSFYTVLYGFLGFTVVSLFEFTSSLLGMHAPFFLFAAAAIVGAIFIYIVLPETKKKTFIEIQYHLSKTSLCSTMKV